MTDHDELLARADQAHVPVVVWHALPEAAQDQLAELIDIIDDLAAALRTALAARPQPLFEGPARYLPRLDAWNVSSWPEGDIVVYPAVAGSATPSGERCRSMEDGTPLTCEFQAGHDGPHSFDPQPVCGTCGQPLENGKCFRYHPGTAAGSATPTRDDDD